MLSRERPSGKTAGEPHGQANKTWESLQPKLKGKEGEEHWSGWTAAGTDKDAVLAAEHSLLLVQRGGRQEGLRHTVIQGLSLLPSCSNFFL